MKNKNIDRLFKKSCFGCFLDLSEDSPARFHIRMVYGLLKHRIKYVEDNKDSEEGGKKMDEIWINYYGMPVYFGLQEFSIVTGLGCHSPEEPSIIKKIPRKRSKERKHKEKIDGLFDIARRGYKALDLLADLMDKTIPNQYRE
ncbi:hypothetical protein FXO38_05029 [Capsicum annuum]|nr:hypothetical protein FXO38_05029 [Capsicum annuum]